MLWILFALLSTWCLVIFTELNRYFKMDGVRLNLWRTVAGMIFLLPLLPFAYWPTTPMFYVFAAFTGIVICLGIGLLMNLAAQGHGRVSSLQMPVKILVLFVLWIMLDPASLEYYRNAPLTTLGILACFAIAGGALALIRKNDLGWRIFLMVAPIGALFALSEIGIKLAMADLPPYQSSLSYIFVAYFVNVVCLFGWLWYRPGGDKQLLPAGMPLAAGLIGAATLSCFLLLLLALAFAPNPAYPSAIQMTMPFWLQLWHKFRGVPDNASPWAGAVMVLAGIGVILLAG